MAGDKVTEYFTVEEFGKLCQILAYCYMVFFSKCQSHNIGGWQYDRFFNGMAVMFHMGGAVF